MATKAFGQEDLSKIVHAGLSILIATHRANFTSPSHLTVAGSR
jgi:hypothetical protein